MLAEVAGRIGRYEDAESLLRRALELCPSFAAARFNLAIVLHRQHRSAEAAAQIEMLLEDDPDSPAYRNLHGAVHSRLGNYEDAVGEFERVLKNRPGDPHLWMNYGHALKTIGRRDESVAAYRHCIGLRRTLGEGWWSLANLKSRVLTDEDIDAMNEILAGKDLSAADRLHLHFALGAAHEDRAAWAASFDHYSKGNAVRRSQIRYDAAETCGLSLVEPLRLRNVVQRLSRSARRRLRIERPHFRRRNAQIGIDSGRTDPRESLADRGHEGAC